MNQLVYKKKSKSCLLKRIKSLIRSTSTYSASCLEESFVFVFKSTFERTSEFFGIPIDSELSPRINSLGVQLIII